MIRSNCSVPVFHLEGEKLGNECIQLLVLKTRRIRNATIRREVKRAAPDRPGNPRPSCVSTSAISCGVIVVYESINLICILSLSLSHLANATRVPPPPPPKKKKKISRPIGRIDFCQPYSSSIVT